MLTRHIIGYVPSFVIPALVAFATIFCYTRLLTPEEYGHYALTTSTMTLLVAVFFSWLQASLPRLMPQAMRQGRYACFQVTAQVIFACVGIALAAMMGIFLACAPPGEFKTVALPALFLTLARALLNLNQSFHRSNLDFRRYNLIECGQAIVGLIAGLSLVYFARLGAHGAIAGLISGLLCMSLVDLRMWMKAPWKEFSPEAFREIVHFSLPLVLSFGLSIIVATSDRFLINYFQGPKQVGIYAAGYTLTDRILGIVFLMIAVPSLPLTVHRLEQEGHEAAREQTRRNGAAVLMLALPACVGLMLTSRQVAHAFIGPAFREGALEVMPLLALSGMLSGLSTHYFDHAFHLGKKTRLFMFTLGPAALLNLALNLILIPRYGILGAAWSALASYALLLSLSATVGRRAFRVRFPFREAVQIGGSAAMMAAVLRSLPFPENLPGLGLMVAAGAATYAFGLLFFDVMGTRAQAQKLLGRLRRGGRP